MTEESRIVEDLFMMGRRSLTDLATDGDNALYDVAAMVFAMKGEIPNMEIFKIARRMVGEAKINPAQNVMANNCVPTAYLALSDNPDVFLENVARAYELIDRDIDCHGNDMMIAALFLADQMQKKVFDETKATKTSELYRNLKNRFGDNVTSTYLGICALIAMRPQSADELTEEITQSVTKMIPENKKAFRKEMFRGLVHAALVETLDISDENIPKLSSKLIGKGGLGELTLKGEGMISILSVFEEALCETDEEIRNVRTYVRQFWFKIKMSTDFGSMHRSVDTLCAVLTFFKFLEDPDLYRWFELHCRNHSEEETYLVKEVALAIFINSQALI